MQHIVFITYRIYYSTMNLFLEKNKLLEKRVSTFAIETIKVIKSLRITIYNKNAIEQVIRSASSVSANYCEANAAVSQKDRTNKIGICRKELQETKSWLNLLINIDTSSQNLTSVWKEADELARIFGTVYSKLRKASTK
jgi:four helix bundle protein